MAELLLKSKLKTSTRVIAKVDGKEAKVDLTNGGIICGDAQRAIVAWLDLMRTSTDQKESAFSLYYDYGPVEHFLGAHHAVVVYPKGTNYKKNGVVLDPWYEQKAGITYDAKKWFGYLSSKNDDFEEYFGKYESYDDIRGPFKAGGPEDKAKKEHKKKKATYDALKKSGLVFWLY